MTDKELRRLSRAELLQMLITQMEENERLNSRIEEMQKELDQRQIAIENSGSIAEAALKLNGVFEAADKAVKQYIESVKQMTEKGKSE